MRGRVRRILAAPVMAAFVVTLVLAQPGARAQGTKWYPWPVLSYYGSYDVSTKKASGMPATSLVGPKSEMWTPPTPKKPYTIGVSFPHLKDSYWLAVDYGIIDEAKQLGVGINLVAAAGYTEITQQINQVENLANQSVDGIIFAGISYSAQDSLVDKVSKKMPVIEVINDIRAPKIAAKALVSFYDMGYQSGVFVAEDSKGKPQVTVAFLPGPAGSGWAPDTLEGFKAATEKLAPGRVKIVDVKYGDTGKNIQLALAEDILNTYPKLDYLVGNAVMAGAAPDAVAARHHPAKIVSTYIEPALYEKIVAGKVGAAPTDFTAIQGRMAVDMMVRLLNGEKPGKDFPFQSGPVIKVVTPQNYKEFSYEAMLGPQGWKPVFTLEAKK
ncbi:MAG: TMAO reductase system periplasmic protein TorT [Bacillati bacterium ANGP1]|uniref:TMAO reductase system periplasmic protein TorT n=1 Tax=Candidatus Segetimicrobium genomatis TaxID=2569760 RepID=A0A537K2B4_9BACT|nr:MAG: TMAO reductase system periplasmic protein TorT [Terrabacteria group bacterium ANGP1]